MQGSDTEAEVNKCLNCEKAKCDNCLSKVHKTKGYMLHGKLTTVEEMARECGLTLGSWRMTKSRKKFTDLELYWYYQMQNRHGKEYYLVTIGGKRYKIPYICKNVLDMNEKTFRDKMYRNNWSAQDVFEHYLGKGGNENE